MRALRRRKELARSRRADSAASPVARAGWSPRSPRASSSRQLDRRRLNAALLVVDTHSGRTATALSNQRGGTLMLALAHDLNTVRPMSLLWGVVSEPMPKVSSRDEFRDFIVQWGRAHGLIAAGSRIVLIRGSDPQDSTHNELEVFEAR